MKSAIFRRKFDENFPEFRRNCQEMTKCLEILRKSVRKFWKMLGISAICEKFTFFILQTRLEKIFENNSSVENLVLLVARVREDKKLVNALARFALQVQEHRLHWFRQLSSEAMKQSLATKLDTYFSI